VSIETDTLNEAEQIADTQAPDWGRELREQVATVLHCSPEQLHPDKGRRADA
jgi:hypothetical protein